MYEDHFIREVRVNYLSTRVETFPIRMPDDIAQFVRSILIDNSREHCVALYLSGAHEVASYSLISIGTANSAHLHAREIFQRAVACGAVSLVIAHNHPSGQIVPSKEDTRVTKQIKLAGELLGIPLLDHVIVTDKSYYSFSESREL